MIVELEGLSHEVALRYGYLEVLGVGGKVGVALYVIPNMEGVTSGVCIYT